jgi:hypothetical protein
MVTTVSPILMNPPAPVLRDYFFTTEPDIPKGRSQEFSTHSGIRYYIQKKAVPATDGVFHAIC